jgi:hypothetical protein
VLEHIINEKTAQTNTPTQKSLQGEWSPHTNRTSTQPLTVELLDVEGRIATMHWTLPMTIQKDRRGRGKLGRKGKATRLLLPPTDPESK